LLSAILFLASIIIISKKTTTSILSPGRIIGSLNFSSSNNPSFYIRGGINQALNTKQITSKIFYNLYNFAKNPQRLISPIILSFFLIFLFVKSKTTNVKKFKLFTIISLTVFLLATSATLPNARYIHPLIPLIIISSSLALIEITDKLKIKHPNMAILLVILIAILPTIGYYTLDARFRKQQFNTNKPPVYKQISSIMAQHIPQDHLIITNLDAWASWYEGLTTMWFPLSPNMLISKEDKINNAEYIVITNYKEEDNDFVLGEWKEVVYNPEKIKNKFLSDNYNVFKTFVIKSEDIYENQEYKGTILVQK